MRWPRRWVTLIVPLGLIVGALGGCPHRATEPEPVVTFHEEIVVLVALDSEVNSEEVGDAH